MKEYIGVDLGKRKAVVVKKDRHGKVTGKAVLAVTEAALSKYLSVYSSGSKSFHGRITKQGPRWLRWICVEISIHAANGDARFQNLYRRVLRRRGSATAKVAVGRKILTIIYAMLKHNEPFRRRRPRQRILAKVWSKKTQAASGHPRGVMIRAQA